MSKNKLDLIEKRLKTKKIPEYEIFYIKKDTFETIFLKNKPDNEREISSSEYFLRILHQSDDKTGVGITKGNSLNPNDIDDNIDTCLRLSKTNKSPKYTFPTKKSLPNVSTIEKSVLKNPIEIKSQLSEKLIRIIKEQKNVVPTFGRFRIHINNSFIRNSNNIDFESLKTFFFIEFSLKAEKDGKLAEYWTVDYYKDQKHLNLEQRIQKWANYAITTLTAELPQSNPEAIVVFPPHVLKEALNPVIGYHSLGKSHYEKTSAFKIDDDVASESISLMDNGLLEGGLNSNPWDGEGNPHQKTTVIDNGIFKNRLYDQKYALIENTTPTGNGIKGDNGGVSNGISNFTIAPGNISLDEIISNIKEGYYIDKFSWLNPDPISGFFGAEIRNGYYIKDGEFSNPIKLGNASGNVLQMIKNCLYISKEREFAENSLFPYIAFKDINISS